MIRTLSALLVFGSLLTSCVGSKKYKSVLSEYDVLSNKFTQLQADLKNCEDDKLKMNTGMQALEMTNSNLRQQVSGLNEQVDFLKSSNTTMLGNLKDMSVISEKQAESVGKSLDKLSERDAYIKDIQSAMARKDSLNLNLVMNLKGAFTDLNDDDIEVKVDKGVVFISISDKLLFNTGQYTITSRAKGVLGKVAQVLNNQPNIEFMVEGHTDNVPLSGAGPLKDNWDLSVLRATSVVRVLQSEYKIDPKRMTAGGRGQYVPVDDSNTAAARSKNRRTRIVVLPQLDQFFQLLESNRIADKPAK